MTQKNRSFSPSSIVLATVAFALATATPSTAGPLHDARPQVHRYQAANAILTGTGGAGLEARWSAQLQALSAEERDSLARFLGGEPVSCTGERGPSYALLQGLPRARAHFQTGSAREDGRGKVGQLAASYVEELESGRGLLVLVGSASQLGTRAGNVALTRRRVKSVVDGVTEFVVEETWIRVISEPLLADCFWEGGSTGSPDDAQSVLALVVPSAVMLAIEQGDSEPFASLLPAGGAVDPWASDPPSEHRWTVKPNGWLRRKLGGVEALDQLGQWAIDGCSQMARSGLSFVDRRVPGLGATAVVPLGGSSTVVVAEGKAPFSTDATDESFTFVLEGENPSFLRAELGYRLGRLRIPPPQRARFPLRRRYVVRGTIRRTSVDTASSWSVIDDPEVTERLLLNLVLAMTKPRYAGMRADNGVWDVQPRGVPSMVVEFAELTDITIRGLQSDSTEETPLLEALVEGVANLSVARLAPLVTVEGTNALVPMDARARDGGWMRRLELVADQVELDEGTSHLAALRELTGPRGAPDQCVEMLTSQIATRRYVAPPDREAESITPADPRDYDVPEDPDLPEL